MTLLLSILVSDIFPIFAIAAVGFLLERHRPGSVAALSAVSFNALSPCLVFYHLVTVKLGGADVGRMALYCVLLIGSMGLIARLAAVPLHLNRTALSSFLLVVMFSNSGNYALPLILFAFGPEALAHASIYFVTGAVVLYTAGVFIAASGGSGRSKGLQGLVRVPAFYALGAAAVITLLGAEPPVVLMRAVGMLSDAALPMMLLVLGMQLHRAALPERPRIASVAVSLSLIAGPLAGLLLTEALGLSGAARNAAVVLAAMPSAVVTTVLALEFDLDSSFVTSVVFISTLLSPITLVLLIAYLRYS